MEKLEILKDEIRDIKLNYVRKDDLDYRALIEKTNKNSEQITELKTRLNNIERGLEKNNNLTESVSIQNVKSTALLESISYQMKDINVTTKENNDDLTKEIKEINEKVNRIDLETSKNTDNRITTKQLVYYVITLLIAACVGGVLVTPVP